MEGSLIWEQGDLTIVNDNTYPSEPKIGSSTFTLSSLGSIGQLRGEPLRIYTAKRSQNSIGGMNNVKGQTFTPGPLYVNTTVEQWGVYYPGGHSGIPYTFFYKDTPPPTPLDIIARNPNAFIPFAELFYRLEKRNGSTDPFFSWLNKIIIECELIKDERTNCLEIPIQYMPLFIKRTRI